MRGREGRENWVAGGKEGSLHFPCTTAVDTPPPFSTILSVIFISTFHTLLFRFSPYLSHPFYFYIVVELVISRSIASTSLASVIHVVTAHMTSR